MELKEEFKKVEVKKGQMYKFCTCGKSKTIPFCDQSHEKINEETGSNFKSLKVIPEEDVILNVTSKNWVDDNSLI